MRYRFAFFSGILLVPSFLGADVTLRYKTDVRPNPSLPPMLTQALSSVRTIVAGSGSIQQRKGTKSYANSGAFVQITDSARDEITVIDPAGKRFATMPFSKYSEELSHQMPEIPAGAQSMLAGMKAAAELKVTGRKAEIQGIQAEEREIVITLDGPAAPGVPTSPMMRVVMQMWMAAPEEVSRNAALREFAESRVAVPGGTNPAESIRKMLGQFPGMGDALGKLMKDMESVHSVILRVHTELFMPMIANLTKLMPPGPNNPGNVDPNAALMEMNQELVEISDAPIADSVFEVPAGYTAAPLGDIMSAMKAGLMPGAAAPKPAAPAPK